MKNCLFSFLLLGIINVLLLGGCGKDNRVVLHSESADHLLIKDGYLTDEGEISKSKLAMAIASAVSSVSEVYDISDELDESWLRIYNKWYILFSVKTTSGQVYTELKCLAFVYSDSSSGLLSLRNCGSDDVQFGDDDMSIPLSQILAQRDGQLVL